MAVTEAAALVQVEDLVVEGDGEGDPGQVGQHEPSGEAVDTPEAEGKVMRMAIQSRTMTTSAARS